MADTDNPWKELMEKLYQLTMLFFLSEAARRVDWTRDYEALETELRALLPASQTGLKYVDKLIKVWCKQTVEGEVLEEGAQEEEFYHFEVQYEPEEGFEKRMSDYNDVARVHLHNHVISVAILGDENPTWRPEVYHWEKHGCELTFKFRMIKLLDWRGREEELLGHANPIALFVLAHLLILPTKTNEALRAEWKLRLWKRVCEHKMEEQDRSTLLRLIDWMLLLPPERNRPLLQELNDMRKEKPMPFVSVFEQEILDQKQQLQTKDQQIQTQAQLIQTKDQLIQTKDQLIQTKDQQLQIQSQQLRASCLEGIALALKLKFQSAGQALFVEVQKQADLAWLRGFLESIESADSVEDLRRLLP